MFEEDVAVASLSLKEKNSMIASTAAVPGLSLTNRSEAKGTVASSNEKIAAAFYIIP